MSTTKILVVEDEILIAEHIKDLLLSYGINQIFLADTKVAALEIIQNTHPDLILLDLHLESPLDGLEIAKLIDEKFTIPYIFITANADRLVIEEVVQTKAAAYITKPLKNTDFFATIQIALKGNESSDSKYFLIKNAGCTLRILITDILYIESNGNYIHIYTTKGKTLSRQSLDLAEEHLPNPPFLRVQRSFLVNTNFVTKMNAKSLFIEETEIPISRINTAEVMHFLKSRL